MNRQSSFVSVLMTAFACLGACNDSGGAEGSDASDVSQDVLLDTADDSDVAISQLPQQLKVMTFNAGTTTPLAHDKGDDGYTQEMADFVDEHYGNGLSWKPAEDALKAFIEDTNPDIAAFQELFYDPQCDDVPAEAPAGLLCEEGPQTPALQIERLMGPDYTILCGVIGEQPDNCVAIRSSLGEVRGCDAGETCMGALTSPAEGCSRLKYGKATVDLEDGSTLGVVNIHGRSGLKDTDFTCRSDQFARIFDDAGDGQPLANEDVNIVLGDINTDPFFLAEIDSSAVAWSSYVGEDKPFAYLSSSDEDGPGTTGDTLRIDHVVSDFLDGDCTVPGSTPGVPPVIDSVYWDHRPVVCEGTPVQ